jgi:quercetin dioxygenase-like cupin family protein
MPNAFKRKEQKMTTKQESASGEMQVHRNGSAPAVKGPSDWFTGQVRIDRIFNPPAPTRGGFALVDFEPGARSNWHTHPLGQTLIVTSGVGWTQCVGGLKTEIRAGDVVFCPCQRRHWHGATATTAMSHIAIAEAIDGKNVDWMEPVTDEQYLAGPIDTK